MAQSPTVVVGVKVDKKELSEFDKMLRDLKVSPVIMGMNASAGPGNPITAAVVTAAVIAYLMNYISGKYLDEALDRAMRLVDDNAKWNEMLKRIDQSKIKYNVGDDFGAHLKKLDEHVTKKIEYFEKYPIEVHVEDIVQFAEKEGVVLPFEAVLEAKPEEIRILFDQADVDEINQQVQERISEIQQKQYELRRGLDSLMPSESKGPIHLPPIYREVEEEIEKNNDAIEQNSKNWSHLDGALAVVGDASLNLAGDQSYLSDATNGVMASVLQLRKEGLDPLPGTTKESDKAVIDLLSSFEDGALIFGYTKEELLGVGSAAGEAAEKTKDLDKNALKGVVDQAGNAEETLGTLNSTTGDLSARSEELAGVQENVAQAVVDGSAAMDNAGASAEQFGEALEQVESSGGFFDGIKQGFIDFVENVESNSELMADFFANTLTEMSQNFSDLFYNVLTGKFDNLQDLAKQAFEAILRAFLDMVAAIATRQIVISIAGAIGIGAKGASAADYLGFGKQAAGLGGDLAGLFGSGGSSAAAIGGGISAVGAGASAAGGASGVGASLGLSGISSVGTVPTGGAATFGLSGISSIPAAGPGFLSAALPWVGAVLAAAAIAYTFLAPLLKKTPRLDIDFDSIKTEAGRRAALVSEILDEDFFTEDIAQISVKRKAGLGVGGNDRIKEMEEMEYRLAA